MESRLRYFWSTTVPTAVTAFLSHFGLSTPKK